MRSSIRVPVPRDSEPGGGFRSQKPGTRKPIVTCLRVKEKIGLNTLACSKMRRNELSGGFSFLGNGTLRDGNPDTATCHKL